VADVEVMSFDSPDEVRSFEGKGKADVVNLGGRVIGRGHLRARLEVVGERQADRPDRLLPGLTPRLLPLGPDEGDHGHGTEGECGPGDVVAIPPGHDAEVVGDEPCFFIDFGEFGDYAKRS